MSKLIVLIFIHVLGDSLLLSQKLRKLKIEKISYLFKHVGIYTAVILVLSPLLLGITIVQGLIFSLLNGVLHIIVDYVFTIIKKKYWASKEYKYIIITSGLEHLIHVTLLIVTFLYLFPYAIDTSNWGSVIQYYFWEKPIFNN